MAFLSVCTVYKQGMMAKRKWSTSGIMIAIYFLLSYHALQKNNACYNYILILLNFYFHNFVIHKSRLHLRIYMCTLKNANAH